MYVLVPAVAVDVGVLCDFALSEAETHLGAAPRRGVMCSTRSCPAPAFLSEPGRPLETASVAASVSEGAQVGI